MNQSVQSQHGGSSFLGLPVGGFGLLSTFLMVLATGFFTFFLTTCLSIFGLLFWNTLGGHRVNYADSYLYIGLPAGVIALVVAFFVLGAAWLRGKMR